MVYGVTKNISITLTLETLFALLYLTYFTKNSVIHLKQLKLNVIVNTKMVSTFMQNLISVILRLLLNILADILEDLSLLLLASTTTMVKMSHFITIAMKMNNLLLKLFPLWNS